MNATELAGSIFFGLVCVLALVLFGMPIVPATLIALIGTCTLIGNIRRRRREAPPPS